MKNTPTLPTTLLHPKHWLSWCLVALIFITVRILPYAVLMKLGSLLGKALDKLLPYRMLVAKTNIQLCFADRDWQTIYRKHCGALGRGLFEMSMGWLAPLNNMHQRVHHHGNEVVDKALASGKGVLFLGMHTTNLDFSAPLLSHKYPVTPMYQNGKNAVFNYIIQRARLKHCPAIIEKNNIRAMISCLKNNECIWYGCDQDFGDQAKAVFSDFYGISAYTLPHYAKIAQKTGAAVIPVACFKNEESGNYEMRYLPEIDVTTLSEQQAADRMNKAIETLLTGFEEQYYWVHRRFKTRPEGLAAVYPPKPNDIRRAKKREQQQRTAKKQEHT